VIPIEPGDLDLNAIREHVKLMHRDQWAQFVWPKDRLEELARLHARWHMAPVGHKHGGDTVSVVFGGCIFSVHPLGWFTGREAKLEVK